jgi:hypothetical protein
VSARFVISRRRRSSPKFLTIEQLGGALGLPWPPEEDALRRILNENAPGTQVGCLRQRLVLKTALDSPAELLPRLANDIAA